MKILYIYYIYVKNDGSSFGLMTYSNYYAQVVEAKRFFYQ